MRIYGRQRTSKSRRIGKQERQQPMQKGSSSWKSYTVMEVKMEALIIAMERGTPAFQKSPQEALLPYRRLPDPRKKEENARRNSGRNRNDKGNGIKNLNGSRRGTGRAHQSALRLREHKNYSRTKEPGRCHTAKQHEKAYGAIYRRPRGPSRDSEENLWIVCHCDEAKLVGQAV